MCPACESNIKLRLKTTPQRVALVRKSLCSRKASTPRRVVKSTLRVGSSDRVPREEDLTDAPSRPRGKGRVWDSWARGAAWPETRGLPAAGRAAGHSPRRRLCTAGARGTPVSRPPWSQGPGGWARCARPPSGLAEATREGGRAGGRAVGGLTRGRLTASTRGPQDPSGCDRKAEGRAVRCRPPCCGRVPPAGLRAPQRAGIRPRHEPITVSSRPSPRGPANPSPRSPTARPRRQVSARLRPARPRARRRGGRSFPQGGAAAVGEERSGPRPSQMGWESVPSKCPPHSEECCSIQSVGEVITKQEEFSLNSC